MLLGSRETLPVTLYLNLATALWTQSLCALYDTVMASCCDGKNGLINQDVIEEDLYSESRELLEYKTIQLRVVQYYIWPIKPKKFHFPLEANKLDLLISYPSFVCLHCSFRSSL